jgi:CheY-like chemotaxis protein
VTPGGPDALPLLLIAEDEPLGAMALRAQVEALGYRVLDTARDGEEAVALAACFPVDVALLDQRMPRCSGFDAATQIFELAPTAVALLTGVGTGDLPDPVPEPPIFRVISKPAGLAEIQRGLDAARERFARWARSPAAPDLDALARQRTLIARATRASAAHGRLAAAAVRLLRQAREQDRALVDVARDVLDA